jgi:hypothetical protein
MPFVSFDSKQIPAMSDDDMPHPDFIRTSDVDTLAWVLHVRSPEVDVALLSWTLVVSSLCLSWSHLALQLPVPEPLCVVSPRRNVPKTSMSCAVCYAVPNAENSLHAVHAEINRG